MAFLISCKWAWGEVHWHEAPARHGHGRGLAPSLSVLARMHGCVIVEIHASRHTFGSRLEDRSHAVSDHPSPPKPHGISDTTITLALLCWTLLLLCWYFTLLPNPKPCVLAARESSIVLQVLQPRGPSNSPALTRQPPAPVRVAMSSVEMLRLLSGLPPIPEEGVSMRRPRSRPRRLHRLRQSVSCRRHRRCQSPVAAKSALHLRERDFDV